MNRERETPREIARGGSRLARTCLLGPPSFSPGSHACVPNTLSYSLHIRGLALHRARRAREHARVCRCARGVHTFSPAPKVFVSPCAV